MRRSDGRRLGAFPGHLLQFDEFQVVAQRRTDAGIVVGEALHLARADIAGPLVAGDQGFAQLNDGDLARLLADFAVPGQEPP